jgi:hypothetical protein
LTLLRKPADERGDLLAGAFQQEVSTVEEMNLGVGDVVGEGACAVWTEDFVATAPDREQRHLAVAHSPANCTCIPRRNGSAYNNRGSGSGTRK